MFKKCLKNNGRHLLRPLKSYHFNYHFVVIRNDFKISRLLVVLFVHVLVKVKEKEKEMKKEKRRKKQKQNIQEHNRCIKEQGTRFKSRKIK